MKKIAVRIAVFVAVLGVLIGVAPSPAQALPALNPVCWISDSRNPAVQKNCKGHDWKWPHWGGGSKFDGPDRGCGGSNIYSDAWYMSASEVSARNYGYLRGTQGIERSELVLLGWVKNNRRFRHDTITYSWKPQVHEWVYYPGTGWMEWYTDLGAYTVTCDLNGHVTS